MCACQFVTECLRKHIHDAWLFDIHHGRPSPSSGPSPEAKSNIQTATSSLSLIDPMPCKRKEWWCFCGRSSSFLVLFRCLSGCDRVLSLIFITPTEQNDTTSTHHQKTPSSFSAPPPPQPRRRNNMYLLCSSRTTDKVSERKRSKP